MKRVQKIAYMQSKHQHLGEAIRRVLIASGAEVILRLSLRQIPPDTSCQSGQLLLAETHRTTIALPLLAGVDNFGAQIQNEWDPRSSTQTRSWLEAFEELLGRLT